MKPILLCNSFIQERKNIKYTIKVQNKYRVYKVYKYKIK